MKEWLQYDYDSLVSSGKPFALVHYPDMSSDSFKLFIQGKESTSLKFYMQPFNKDISPHVISDCTQETYRIAGSNRKRKGKIALNSNAIGNDYEKKVAHLVDYLPSSNLKKAVLSTVFPVSISESPYHIFTKLLAQYPRATVYLWWHPETGNWAGATPENLLTVENDEISTMALAGTRPAGIREPWGEKEKEEQQLVTDAIVDLLREEPQLNDIIVSQPFTKNAGPVSHICTSIKARGGEGLSGFTLSRKLHPTPAVAGLPRLDAIQYIKANEEYDRELYTGFFGYEDESQRIARFYVNLRCMKILSHEIKLYVGAGITASSIPSAEKDEILNKVKTLTSIL